ncbi:regucalcin-like isoform 2-T2 [Callospermophilus lateralis]
MLTTDLPLSPGTMPEASAPGVWEPGQGSLYTLYADRSMVRQLDELGIPNGLDWSLDHHTLYHVDGLDYSVRAYDYDVQTGGLANPRLVCQLEPEQGMPDGLFMDTTGTLWVACIDGGRVIRMDAETGTRLCTPEMPVSRVMSCCFGGADYSDLYVTSAADSLSPEQLLQEPQAGHVFKVLGLGVRGLASCHFSG